MTTVVEIRDALANQANCEFISAEQFVSHLTSHSQLERCDEPQGNLIGLKSLGSGRRFYVPAEELSRLESRTAASRI